MSQPISLISRAIDSLVSLLNSAVKQDAGLRMGAKLAKWGRAKCVNAFHHVKKGFLFVLLVSFFILKEIKIYIILPNRYINGTVL